VFVAAVAFEAGLGVIALGAGALLGHSPLAGAERGATLALATGTLAALPLVALLAASRRLPWEWLRELRRLASELLPELFPRATRTQLLLVSIAAGFGEELLFRGLVQAGLARWIGGASGAWIGLGVGALLFGLAHPISRAYAVLAGVIGLYLGGLMMITGSVLAPLAAHAVYDFLALELLLRRSPGPAAQPRAPEVETRPDSGRISAQEPARPRSPAKVPSSSR
jgi:hypothetical protein